MMPPRITNPNDDVIGYLDEILTVQHEMNTTLELIEQSLGVLVWQGMPWWRRWAASWRDARRVVDETDQEGQAEP